MKHLSRLQRKRLNIYNKQNGKCIYCNIKMWSRGAHLKGTRNTMATIEHIHPAGLGGGKNKENLACSCSRCNRNRGQTDHFVFMSLRKKKNWKLLAKEEKWKTAGIYSRKKREYRWRAFYHTYGIKYPLLITIIQKFQRAVRFKNKHLHFTKLRINKLKKRIPEIKKNLKGLKWRIHNKTKSLILNVFKQFKIQSFRPLSY